MSNSLLDKWQLLGAVNADPDLPPSAKSTAYFLLNHYNLTSGRCDPSLKGLAEQVGVSVKTITTAIDALAAGGYFERSRGGGRERTTYFPQWLDVKSASQHEDDLAVKSSAGTCEAQRPPAVKSPSHEYGKEKPVKEDGNINTDSGFSEFWMQYPKKKERGSAENAYRLALKKADHRAILDGVLRYAAERVDEDPQYTKYPATWLSKECWSDEPSPTGATHGSKPAKPNPHRNLADGFALAAGANANSRPDGNKTDFPNQRRIEEDSGYVVESTAIN